MLMNKTKYPKRESRPVYTPIIHDIRYHFITPDFSSRPSSITSPPSTVLEPFSCQHRGFVKTNETPQRCLKQVNFPSEKRQGPRRTPCLSACTEVPKWRPPTGLAYWARWPPRLPNLPNLKGMFVFWCLGDCCVLLSLARLALDALPRFVSLLLRKGLVLFCVMRKCFGVDGFLDLCLPMRIVEEGPDTYRGDTSYLERRRVLTWWCPAEPVMSVVWAHLG